MLRHHRRFDQKISNLAPLHKPRVRLEVASECLDERWCCVNAKHLKSFGHKNLSNGRTRPTAKIDDSGPAWQRFGPVADHLHPDTSRAGATGTTCQKLGSDPLVSVSIDPSWTHNIKAGSLPGYRKLAARATTGWKSRLSNRKAALEDSKS